MTSPKINHKNKHIVVFLLSTLIVSILMQITIIIEVRKGRETIYTYVETPYLGKLPLNNSMKSNRIDKAHSNTHLSTSSSQKLPNLVWLMSYPNSGTTYTIEMTSKDSNLTMATNYQKDVYNKEIHVINKDLAKRIKSDMGPLDVANPVPIYPQMNIPKDYMIVKTHCTGYSVKCDKNRYTIEHLKSFVDQCRTGKKYILDYDFGDNSAATFPAKERKYTYKYNRVKKAIHLIRNPFDNIVSNYHHQYGNNLKSNNQPWLNKYSKDKHGFRAWCMDHNLEWSNEKERLEADNLPCFKLFYKYMQWHTMTLHSIEKLKLESLTIYYDDYQTKFEETKEKIFSFANLPNVQSITTFSDGKTYLDYFTREERIGLMNQMKSFHHPKLDSSNTWDLIKRYDKEF